MALGVPVAARGIDGWLICSLARECGYPPAADDV
jgi:hypothetical protein